jgi:23S rRNA (uracil1939-C5)-methyltransferase
MNYDVKRIDNIGLSEKIIKQIIDIIIKYSDPGKIMIFGSRARGDFKKTSDIDIAIEGGNNPGYLREILDEDLNTLLNIDVVYLDKIENNFKKEILNEGLIVYEKT